MTTRLGRLIAGCGMTKGREPRKRWDTGRFALYGAFLGFGVGVIHAYVHAFWSGTYDDFLLTHLLTQMVVSVGIGDAGFGAVSAIRNWLRRKP